MPPDFITWAHEVRRLHAAVQALAPQAAAVGAPPAEGQEWHELLARKLLPQATGEATLVAAVVGGTNIGKSALFNQLAGEVASRVSPLAAGTKHPVCLAPPELANEQTLGSLFEGFSQRPWHSADDPLVESGEHQLFWRVGENVPARLLLLDTPDIDSDATVNWQRADCIRQAADVLVAVLTQQKYNDAAVKRFFREAAAADKPLVVVFNQCDLAADRDYWPLWLETFCGETGARPLLVYVVPHDRAAADHLGLTFYEVGADGRGQPTPAAPREALARLRFDEIKLRTLRGAAARVADPQAGLPAWLDRIRAASAEHAAAATALSTREMARVAWPALPSRVLVEEIRQWWDGARAPWSRAVHGAYRTVGRVVLWPVRAAYEAIGDGAVDPLAAFQSQERAAILEAVEKMLAELDRLARVGSELLRPRLRALLGGPARASLLERIEAAHQQLPPVSEDYRQFLRTELDQWRRENPRMARSLSYLDQALAVARPAITVSLVVSGWIVAGSVVGDVAAQAAAHTAGNLATEAAITAGTSAGGEALVGGTAEGFKHAAARLMTRLQRKYAEGRAAWLASWLERELLGELLHDLRRGAETPARAEFAAVERALESVNSAVH